jgi:hypothetical protein
MWQQTLEESLERAEAFNAQLSKLADGGMERAATAVDQMAKLTKDSLTHALKAGTEWRSSMLEAGRQTAKLFRPSS